MRKALLGFAVVLASALPAAAQTGNQPKDPQIENCVFANGYSGHGLQQGPATGRGVSELILNGRYVSLDLSSLSWERVLEDRPIVEKNVV